MFDLLAVVSKDAVAVKQTSLGLCRVNKEFDAINRFLPTDKEEYIVEWWRQWRERQRVEILISAKREKEKGGGARMLYIGLLPKLRDTVYLFKKALI